MTLMCCRNLLACLLVVSAMAGLTDRSLDAATNNFNTTHGALVGIAVTSHKAGKFLAGRNP